MIVLDTHAWIWWVSDPAKLSAKARGKLEKAKHLGVAAVSCWEVAMLVEKGRIELDRPTLDWIEQALAQPGVELLPLTPAVAVRATELGTAFHGDPADCQIVATALIHSATLVTRDERMLSYDGVKTHW